MPDVTSVIKCLFTVTLLHTSSRAIHHIGYQLDARVPFPASQKFYPNSTEALYSPWSTWSACSHTCGVGISMRSRTCRKRVENSKTEESICLGDSIEHKICKLQVCPPGTPDSRASQCSRYNNRVVVGQKDKTWIPTSTGTNPCELRCQSEDGMVSGFGKVEDGTPCNGGICLDGRCLKIGCDEKLGTGAEIDMCGVCRGRNVSCVHYKDVFHGQLTVMPGHERRRDYQEVGVIPAGARNLEIRQGIGENILAIRDRNTAVLYHGRERQVPNPKLIAGTVLTYARDEDNRTEILRTVGPTTAELYVLVLLGERNPGIYYQYWLPLQQPHSNRYLPTLPTISTPSKTTLFQVQTTQPPSWSTYVNNTSSPLYRTIPSTTQQYRKQSILQVYPSKVSTTKYPLNYGPKRRGFVNPLFNDPIVSSPSFHEQNIQHFTAPEEFENVFGKGRFLPKYPPSYRTRKPVYDYYEKYRNMSYYPSVNVYKKPVYLPPQTQRDSSSSINDDAKKNLRHKGPKPEKKKLLKDENFAEFDKDPNERWKYTINGKKNDSDKLQRLTTPVSIAVLPLPETRNYTKTRRGKRRGLKHQSNSRLTRGESCPPCQRVKDQTRHFCTSDFVIRASVVGYDFIHGETRYELEVLQSFKNTFALLSREYIWAPDTCRCPKLRIGKDYLLMGYSDNKYRRNESRLLIDRSCFVRNYNNKFGRRLLRLRKDRARKCSNKVS